MTLSDQLLRQTGWAPLDEENADALVAQQSEAPDAVRMPFPSWNRVCRDEGGGVGVARGWHDTIAAGSGKGKSILAANIVRTAIEDGERVGFISLEMSQRQLDTRQLAVVSGENIRTLEMGQHFREECLRRALGKVQEIKRTTGGRVYRSPEMLRGILDIEGAITFLRNGPPRCRFFIIDYLQLGGDPNDPASITDVSHRVRQLARDLDVITIGLSQFNRDLHRRGGQPTIHDLMGGSALENDSDQVLLLDHTRIERSPAPLEGWDAYLLIGKNRHGPSVEIPIRFDTRTLRFEEIKPDELAARRAA